MASSNTYIFIDGSYYKFHRFFSLMKWWKMANKNDSLDNPIENEYFVEKFKKTFIEKIKEIPKKVKMDKKCKPIFIVGNDCKRSTIWRNNLLPSYKDNRSNEGFLGAPFFKMVKDESLFENAGIDHIIEHEKLEADDCIAIYVKKLREKQPNCKIYIITSDCDYLQINYENVFIYNLSYKLIEDNKLYTKNCIDDLLVKIIMGDKSDNIPPIFPRCGLKIAKKCIEDKEYFKSIMKDEKIKNQFEKNQKLIDFEMIPADLRESLLNKYKYIYE